MSKKLQVAIGVIVLAVLYFVSPYWALAGLTRAAIENRVDDFAEFIDLDEIKLGVARRIESQSPQSPSFNIQAIEAVATARAVHAMITPAVVSNAFAAQLQEYSADSRPVIAWRLFTHNQIAWKNPLQVSLGPAGSMHRAFLTWKLDHFGAN